MEFDFASYGCAKHLIVQKTYLYGVYLIIRASKLERTSSFQGGYVVLFERARPEEIFPLIMEGYSFTTREKQVIRKILTGMSTKELAQELCISIYTVQDHLKSIFEKTGVSSRNELVWEVFRDFALMLMNKNKSKNQVKYSG